MAIPRSRLARLCAGAATALAAAAALPVFLLAALLVLVAPLPQLAIHARWCHHLGPPGWAVLALGAVGAVAVAAGLARGRAALHRAGIVLVVVPVVGAFLHRAATTGEWWDLSLLGAFLFGALLTYLAASEGT